MTPEAREAYTARRVHRWRSALSPRDRARIRALADQVAAGAIPAGLSDLDARTISVRCIPADHEGRVSGERIGTLRDGAVLVLALPKR